MNLFDRLCRISLAACLAVVVTAPVAPALAQAAPARLFAPHQAVYELSLKKTRRNPPIQAARGRILYNFSGSICEGFTTDLRQLAQIDSGEGNVKTNDMRSTSFEEGDAKSYRFRFETLTEGTVTSLSDGVAEKTGEGIRVRLTKPSSKTVSFRGDIAFPTEQVRRILSAARAGQSFLELDVYDGSMDGEKLFNTFTVIGAPAEGTPAGSAAVDASEKASALNAMKRWPVHVSYFDQTGAVGEKTPVYAMAFELYENGVSRALILDYQDFVIGGRMDKIDLKDPKPCRK